MRGINEESSNFRHIDLNRILTREPWISRRARYPETTEIKPPKGGIPVNLTSVTDRQLEV